MKDKISSNFDSPFNYLKLLRLINLQKVQWK